MLTAAELSDGILRKRLLDRVPLAADHHDRGERPGAGRPAGGDRLHPARRPQDLGGGADPPRPERGRSLGPAAIFRRPPEVRAEGADHPVRRQQGRVPPCSLGLMRARARRLGGDPDQSRLGDLRHQCRRPLHLRDFVAVDLRHHHGRLVVELEISVPGGAALGGADGVLRGLDRLRHHYGAALRRHAEPLGRGRGAACPGPRQPIGLPQLTILNWYVWPLFPMFVIFYVSALAETNRPPFDLVEAESELVAGFMVEYGSTPYLLFMLGEYVAIATMCAMATILFLGGWLPPVDLPPFNWGPGSIWFSLKLFFMFFLFAMARAIVPRYRYDQLMRLGWKVFLPLSLAMVIVVAGVLQIFGLAPK